MLNMMTSQIYKTVLEKCNYESFVLYGIVESNCGPFEDKVQCLMNKRHNELEKVQSQVTDTQCQMMDLLTPSMAWIAEQLFFCLKTSVS